MLKTYRAGAVALTALMASAAGSATAEQYEILMMENAFFPEVTYVQDGDTITFVNMSGIPRAVQATDGSWVTAALEDGESFPMTVDTATFPEFQAAFAEDQAGDGDEIGNGENGTLTDDNVTTTATGDDSEAADVTIAGSLDFSTPGLVAD